MVSRELEAKVILAVELALKGFKVVLAEKHLAMNYATSSSGAIFFSIWGAHEKFGGFYRQLKSLGNTVVSLDEEAFVTMGAEFYSKSRLNPQSIEHVDLFLCLGAWDRGLIEGLGLEIETKIVGNPRVDVLAKQNALDVGIGENLLFASPFGFANHFLGGRTYLDQLKNSGVLREEATIDLYERYLVYQTESMKCFLGFAKHVQVSRPDLKVLYRCHPAENVEKIADFFSGWGVQVSQNRTLSDDLRDATIVVHNFCTVGLEAQLIGKKTVAYAPISFGTEDEAYVYENSVIARNFGEGIEAIDGLLNQSIPVRQFSGGERISILEEGSASCIAKELSNRFGATGYTKPARVNSKFLMFVAKKMLRSKIRGKNKYFETRQLGLDIENIRHIVSTYHPDTSISVKKPLYGPFFELESEDYA